MCAPASRCFAADMASRWLATHALPPALPLPAGHSATAGASGAVLAQFFGADAPFEIGTEFPNLPTRTYASVQEVGRLGRPCLPDAAALLGGRLRPVPNAARRVAYRPDIPHPYGAPQPAHSPIPLDLTHPPHRLLRT